MYWSLVVLTGVLLLHNMSAHDSQPVSFCPDVLISGCNDRCIAATKHIGTRLPTCVSLPWYTDLLYWQVCCCYTTYWYMTPNWCLCPDVLISGCIARCVAATQHINTRPQLSAKPQRCPSALLHPDVWADSNLQEAQKSGSFAAGRRSASAWLIVQGLSLSVYIYMINCASTLYMHLCD